MDFNNIQLRIERIYSAIGDTIISNPLESMKQEISNDENWSMIYKVSFDLWNSNNYNKLFSTINELRNLKDILKNKLREKELDSTEVEDKINNSNYLKIIWDLSNADKHWYPTTTNRSWKHPKIINIRNWLKLDPLRRWIVIEWQNWANSNNLVLFIDADIVDSDNNFLYNIEDLINWAISDWEVFISEKNLYT